MNTNGRKPSFSKQRSMQRMRLPSTLPWTCNAQVPAVFAGYGFQRRKLAIRRGRCLALLGMELRADMLSRPTTAANAPRSRRSPARCSGLAGAQLEGVDEIGRSAAAMPAARDAAPSSSSRSSPCAGSSSAGSPGSMRTTSPAIQSRPGWCRTRGRAWPAAACRRRCRGTACRADHLALQRSIMPGTP